MSIRVAWFITISRRRMVELIVTEYLYKKKITIETEVSYRDFQHLTN